MYSGVDDDVIKYIVVINITIDKFHSVNFMKVTVLRWRQIYYVGDVINIKDRLSPIKTVFNIDVARNLGQKKTKLFTY